MDYRNSKKICSARKLGYFCQFGNVWKVDDLSGLYVVYSD